MKALLKSIRETLGKLGEKDATRYTVLAVGAFLYV
jgi:hypothetical protein